MAKKDIMGAIAVTGDRLGLSVRKKTMLAASVCSAVGIDIQDTNVSTTSAWRRTRKERLDTAKAVKDNFVKPKYVTVHWDGKILKVNGNMQSNRVAVYITSVEEVYMLRCKEDNIAITIEEIAGRERRTMSTRLSRRQCWRVSLRSQKTVSPCYSHTTKTGITST